MSCVLMANVDESLGVRQPAFREATHWQQVPGRFKDLADTSLNCGASCDFEDELASVMACWRHWTPSEASGRAPPPRQDLTSAAQEDGHSTTV